MPFLEDSPGPNPRFLLFFFVKRFGSLIFCPTPATGGLVFKTAAWVETCFGFTADVFEEVEPTEILRCMRAAMRKTCRLNVMEEESITRESQGVMESGGC